ncbi:aldose 1-epimerase [Geminicoccus roseus]|uniref:aldose 1-epimerase n=1 Tax=Geminicoccus roseus TaxID=404900 RepID=UPI000422F84F|nr:aldose 1-epimerase [Geminicoccus roseus]
MSAGDVVLEQGGLSLVVSPQGGVVRHFRLRIGGRDVPLLREPPPGSAGGALESACFPLVPFGNRLRGNRFRHQGRDYHLPANRPGDPLYLHGDGWLADWTVAARAADRVVLRMEHRSDVYAYRAEQEFRLDPAGLTMTLAVSNAGAVAMPFGLGWHPYFTRTPAARLTVRARARWEEDAAFLPTVRVPVQGDLDFAAGAPLPGRWVNSCFEGWDGVAEIAWPERDLCLRIQADRLFDRFVLFLSDPSFEPSYRQEHFCFEPMSHSVAAHTMAGGGGLRSLEPGEALSGSMRLTWRTG